MSNIDPDPADDDRSPVDQLERLEALGSDVDALSAALDEKIDDVRHRVIQVKQETDEKAASDHGHDALDDAIQTATTRLDTVEDRLTSLDQQTGALDSQLDSLTDRVDTGFENSETVLETLDERSRDLESKAELLARAIIDLRQTVEETTDQLRNTQTLDTIKREANLSEVRVATCAGCSSRVDIALLSQPQCPHCKRAVGGVEGSSGLFGSATLELDSETPALEAPTAERAEGTSSDSQLEADLESLADDGSRHRDGGTRQ